MYRTMQGKNTGIRHMSLNKTYSHWIGFGAVRMQER